MTNKWTVNGVEAPEGAEFYAHGSFRKLAAGSESIYVWANFWTLSWVTLADCEKATDYQERPTQLSRIDIIATNGNDGEHYSDYAFCLSEAINKLKHCADVAPNQWRKNSLLEIVEEVEFIKSEGDK